MTVRFGRLRPAHTSTRVEMMGASRVTENNIVDGSVTTPKLADGAVTVAKTTGIHSQAAADAHAALDLPSAHPAPTGPLSMNNQRLTDLADPVALTDAVTRAFAEDILRQLAHQDPVLTEQAAPPGAPSAGDRYLITAGGSGAWLGHDDEIAEWDGADWIFVVPAEGFWMSIIDSDILKYHNGTTWTHYGSRVDASKLGGQLPAYYSSQAALDAHAALDKSSAHPGVLETADIANGAITAAKVGADVATLDGFGHLAQTARKIRLNGGGPSANAGEIAITGDNIVYRNLANDTNHTLLKAADKGVANGVPSLNSGGVVEEHIRRIASGTALTAREVRINGDALTYRNEAADATHTVLKAADKGAVNGVASIDAVGLLDQRAKMVRVGTEPVDTGGAVSVLGEELRYKNAGNTATYSAARKDLFDAHTHTVVNGLKPAAGIATGTLNASGQMVLNTGLATITGFPDPIGISPESTPHDFYIVSIAGGSITLQIVNASTGGNPGAVNYNFSWIAFGT